MVKMVEMDEAVKLRQQMGQEVGPVILINKFTVGPEEVEAFMRAWAEDAPFFKRQPEFISTQLHRGIGGNCTSVNYAVWESVARFQEALSRPEFQEALKSYLPSAPGRPSGTCAMFAGSWRAESAWKLTAAATSARLRRVR